MATQNWGGQRVGAGRPAGDTPPEQTVSIRLFPEDIAALRDKGRGNASAGMRLLVEAYSRGLLGPLGSGSAHTGKLEAALSVSLPPSMIVSLLAIGGGNISVAVRRLVHAGKPKTAPEDEQSVEPAQMAPPKERQPDMAPANIARLQAARGGMLGRLLVRYLDSQGWYDEEPDWSPGDYDETDPDSWSESDWDTHIHQLVALMARMQ